jgi:hypothetical protein
MYKSRFWVEAVIYMKASLSSAHYAALMMPYDLFIGSKITKTPAEAGVFYGAARRFGC